jgi:hypothetical protein
MVYEAYAQAVAVPDSAILARLGPDEGTGICGDRGASAAKECV